MGIGVSRVAVILAKRDEVRLELERAQAAFNEAADAAVESPGSYSQLGLTFRALERYGIMSKLQSLERCASALQELESDEPAFLS